MSRLRHERRLTSRCGVSGARRVPNCPGASPPPSRPPRHTLASGTTSPIKARAKAAAPRPYNAAAPRGPAPAPDRSCAQHTGVHAATPRHCVSGAGRVARCPGTANPVWRPARHFNPGSRPARHTLAMRPPQKARPFSSINHPRAESLDLPVTPPHLHAVCTPSLRATLSRRPLAPPACAVHPRRPLALPTRAALWRRPLA